MWVVFPLSAQNPRNGDIEDLKSNKWPRYWRAVGGVPAFLGVDSAISNSGKYSLRITDTRIGGGQNAGFRNTICGAMEDSSYTVKCQIYTVNSTATLYIEFFDDNGNLLKFDLRDQISQNQWSTMSFSSTAPANADSIGIRLYSKSDNTGTIYGDDFEILGPKPIREESTTARHCADEDVRFFGAPVDSSGLYTIDIDSGCYTRRVNSLITLHPSYHFPLVDITTCENEFLLLNADTIYAAGIYTDSFKTQYGCDSIFQYRVTLKEADTTVLPDINICEGTDVRFAGMCIDTSGLYEKVFTGAGRCDSTVIQHISIHPTYFTELTDRIICPGEVINVFGNSVGAAGIYTRTFQTINGCDSIISQAVSVHPINTKVLGIGNTAYALEDSALSYQWINCDLAVPVSGAQSQSFVAPNSGNYAARIRSKNGCVFTTDCIFIAVNNDTCTHYDTIIHHTFDTTVIRVMDTTFTEIFDTTTITIRVFDTSFRYISVTDTLKVKLNDIEGCGSIDVKIYPNPANNFVYLEVSDFDCLVMSKFNLYNSIGQILWTDQLVEDRVIKVPIHRLAAGVYYVDCLDSLGNRMFVKKLVIQ
jgi:hypothetical protein